MSALALFVLLAAQSVATADTNTTYASFSNDLTGKIQPFALFSSQTNEVDSAPLNVIQGMVPTWLSGTLYRVGSGMFEIGNRRVNNLVDGLSKVHSWAFIPGKRPRFTAKFLQSKLYNKTLRTGNFPAMQHMGDMIPDLSFWEKLGVEAALMTYGSMDNNNVAVWELSKASGGICVTTESPLYIDVDPETLQFKKEYHVVPKDFGMMEKELISATHFARHPSSGDSINYKFVLAMNPLASSGYHMIRYSDNAKGKLIATKIGFVPVPMGDVGIVHSLGATENYAILPRFCLGFSMGSMVSMCENISFKHNKKTIFDVVALKDGKHTAFEFPAGESQHIINSYERFNKKNELEIVVDYPTKNDVSKYPKECVFQLLNVDRLKDDNYSYQEHWECFSDMVIRRYILNMETKVGTIYEFPKMWNPKVLQVEFPYMNDNYRGLPYCYSYFHAWQYDVKNSMGLIKIDMCKETSIGWEEQNKFTVEPIFAPRPGATAEDDGVVFSPVFDSSTNITELYIWNATDLSVLAILDSPFVVPFTLHGVWKQD